MVVQIKQNSVSINDSYTIFVDGALKYIAESKLFKLKTNIGIFQKDAEKSIIEIRKNSIEKKANYAIVDFRNEKIYEFEDINNIKLKYRCEIKDDFYTINGNPQNKFSIFKNNFQIAYFQKSFSIVGEGNFYELICDDDAEIIILISFVLCIDNNLKNFSINRNPFAIDFGFFGQMLDKFDENWKPK